MYAKWVPKLWMLNEKVRIFNKTKWAKSEWAKSEWVKSEWVKSEGVKSEGVKSEWAKSEGAKSEWAKSEGVKSEGVKSEWAKSEFPQITVSSMELFFVLCELPPRKENSFQMSCYCRGIFSHWGRNALSLWESFLNVESSPTVHLWVRKLAESPDIKQMRISWDCRLVLYVLPVHVRKRRHLKGKSFSPARKCNWRAKRNSFEVEKTIIILVIERNCAHLPASIPCVETLLDVAQIVLSGDERVIRVRRRLRPVKISTTRNSAHRPLLINLAKWNKTFSA